MKKNQICLSVSKRNNKYLDLLDEYTMEFNMNKTQTIFRILKEYNTFKCQGVIQ